MPCSTSANGGWRRSSSFSIPATRVGGARGGVRERPHLFLRKPRSRRAGVGDAVRGDRGAARSAHQGDGPRSAGAAALRRVVHGRDPRRSRELAPHERTGHDSDRRSAAEHAHPRGIGAPDLHRRGNPHRRRSGAAPRTARRPPPESLQRHRARGAGLLARDRPDPRLRGLAAHPAVSGSDLRGIGHVRRSPRAPRASGGRRDANRGPRLHADRSAGSSAVSRFGFAALAILIAIAALAIAGPFLWTIPPEATDPAHGLAGASAAHPLGTDELGRDVLSRLLHGSRVTLLVGVAAMLAALFIGVVVGAVAGWSGGWADALLMRFTDAMLAVPAFFFILVVITVLDTGVGTLILVIGALSWMPVARVVYGETLRWKAAEFVVAAQSLGVPAPRLLARHILPQAIPSLVVSATLGVAFAILTESALSYLGLGVQPPLPSWGNMLQRAQQYVFTAPVLAIYPGVAITVVVLAFNFLGDGLRDALDPRRRR